MNKRFLRAKTGIKSQIDLLLIKQIDYEQLIYQSDILT